MGWVSWAASSPHLEPGETCTVLLPLRTRPGGWFANRVECVQVSWAGSLAPFVQVKLCLFWACGQLSGICLPGDAVRTEMLEFVSAI